MDFIAHGATQQEARKELAALVEQAARKTDAFKTLTEVQRVCADGSPFVPEKGLQTCTKCQQEEVDTQIPLVQEAPFVCTDCVLGRFY
jgi:hypothetical protein